MAAKKRCSECKFVDKSKGDANWICTNVSAYSEKSVPGFFPRVFTNDKCGKFVASEKKEITQ